MDSEASSSSDTAGRYMFEAAWQAEHQRLKALETIWDAYTFENLARAGISPGMRCLEAGAGGGSVAVWLRERVGPSGHVVATDLDTRFLEPLRGAYNIEVRRHDIVQEALERGAYDVVHVRLLLSHLPEHREALQHLIQALKPDGVLVAEEFDHVSFLPDPDSNAADRDAWDAFLRAFEALSAHRGLDLAYGRRLAGLLEVAGLEDVTAEGKVTMERGGVEPRALLRLSIESLRDTLIATGVIDGAGIDRLLALLQTPGFRWMSQIMVAATGRKAR